MENLTSDENWSSAQAAIQPFKQVFDQNPIPVMLYHLLKEGTQFVSYEIIYANDAAMELLHLQKEQIIGKTVARFSAKRLDFLIRANAGTAKTREIYYDDKAGKYLDLAAYSVYENYVAFVMTDITEQIRQEQQAKSERDKYLHLLDAIPGGIAVFDIIRGGRVEINYFNDEICKLTGYTREEIQQNGAHRLCEAISEDWYAVNEKAKEAIVGSEPVEAEFRICKKGGEIRYLRARIAVEKVNEEKLLVYVAYIDITLQKQTESAITTEAAYLTTANDNNLLGKCRANVSRNMIEQYSANENMAITSSSTQYSDSIMFVASRCATKNMAEDFQKYMLPEALEKTFQAGAHEQSIEYMRKMKDGTSLWVRTIARLYADPDTQDVMCFMYTYDIDQEKVMQMIVDRMTEHEFDMLGLLYVYQDKLHCVRASDM
ncbi:MAG: PAS domain-containing protein, partial [Lachnospiraceae bacterium]|nr:PAS domain-containing protein [Lachnospiraceae bacterium]